MHKSQGLLVQCMDWRIQDTLNNLLRDQGIGTADRVSIPGGAGKNPELVDQWTALSVKLHDPDTLIVTVHEDCGAGATKDDLVEAFNRIQQMQTKKTVKAFFVKLNGTWEEVN